jgi:hypothetical protein
MRQVAVAHLRAGVAEGLLAIHDKVGQTSAYSGIYAEVPATAIWGKATIDKG